MSMIHPSIEDVADRPVSGAITIRGKELAATATVGEARALFESSSVQLVPVLNDGVYVGAVSRDDIAEAPDAEPITEYATSRPPIATASTSVGAAIDSLIQDGGRRLVVLGDDSSTYIGLMCLTRDRARLCVDAECHAG